MKKIFAALLLASTTLTALPQEEIPLYPGKVPNSKDVPNKEKLTRSANGRIGISKVSVPTLTIFRPHKDSSNGKAVIICPGGGYRGLAMTHEGYDVAKELNSWGITAFVLKYRMPEDTTMEDKSIGPLQDAQTALQIVRTRAKEWGIKKDKVGIMGFSAGGHLASTAGTHFNQVVIENKKKLSLRPDFMILIYPVISFSDSLEHKGSRVNLIGEQPSVDQVQLYSNELQVTAKTPPTFLIHAKDDKAVKYQNSTEFAAALAKKKVPAEIHLFDGGGHGFGMINSTTSVLWMDWLKVWIQQF